MVQYLAQIHVLQYAVMGDDSRLKLVMMEILLMVMDAAALAKCRVVGHALVAHLHQMTFVTQTAEMENGQTLQNNVMTEIKSVEMVALQLALSKLLFGHVSI